MNRTMAGALLAAGCALPIGMCCAQAQPQARAQTTSAPVKQVVRALPAQDALSRCLVDSTSPEDRRVLVKWVFSTLAQHPDIATMARIDPAQRDLAERQAARVFERLLTEKCTAPLKVAIKQSGTDAIGKSFEALGSAATGELLQNGQVVGAGAGLMKHLNAQKIMLSLIAQ